MKISFKSCIYVFFYSIVFLLIDLLVLIVLKADNSNVFTIIATDLFIGILFSFLLYFIKGNYKIIAFCFINFFVLFILLFSFVQIFSYLSFSHLYNTSTIFVNAINIFKHYRNDVLSILLKNLLLTIILFSIIVSLIVLSYRIYFYNDEIIDYKHIILLSYLSSMLLIIGLFITKFDSVDWTNNVKNNGVKLSIVYDLFNKDEYYMFEDEKVENTENAKNENEETSEENEKYPKSIYNVLDYDFEELINNENKYDFNTISRYISSKEPTKKNEYTGLFKDKNLIMICAEAFNSSIINEELFPTIYRLMNNGIKFNNFYQPHGASSTSSGEYCFMTGMVPTSNDTSFLESTGNNMGFTISKKLKEIGYNTYSFHNCSNTFYNRNDTHLDFMGFDKFINSDTGLQELCNKRNPDDELLFDRTFDIYANDEKFLAYYMTYSGHLPYTDIYEETNKNVKIEKVLNTYSDIYPREVCNYIIKNLYLEEGLTHLINHLEKKDLLNDTVICMVPDHYPYGLSVNKENIMYLYKTDEILTNDNILDKTDIILWCGSFENEDKDKVKTIDGVASPIDLTPTLLNLFGLDFDSRIYPGKDVFSDEERIVVYQDGRFITDEIKQGKIKTYKPENTTDSEKKAINIINYCKFLIKNDYYGYIEGETNKHARYCYLTFEGGPTDNTFEIVKILKEKNVTASFLIVGDQKLEYLNYIKNNGNSIGIYSSSSDYYDMYKSLDNFIINFDGMMSQIKRKCNLNARFLRFPGGINDEFFKNLDPDLVNSMKQIMQSRYVNYLEWNVDSEDYLGIDKDTIINNVLKGVEFKNVVCVRLHDTDEATNTLEALPELIDRLKELKFNIRAWNSYSHKNNQFD